MMFQTLCLLQKQLKLAEQTQQINQAGDGIGDDESIDSDDLSSDSIFKRPMQGGNNGKLFDEDDEQFETVDEKRMRLSKQILNKLKLEQAKQKEIDNDFFMP